MSVPALGGRATVRLPDPRRPLFWLLRPALPLFAVLACSTVGYLGSGLVGFGPASPRSTVAQAVLVEGPAVVATPAAPATGDAYVPAAVASAAAVVDLVQVAGVVAGAKAPFMAVEVSVSGFPGGSLASREGLVAFGVEP